MRRSGTAHYSEYLTMFREIKTRSRRVQEVLRASLQPTWWRCWYTVMWSSCDPFRLNQFYTFTHQTQHDTGNYFLTHRNYFLTYRNYFLTDIKCLATRAAFLMAYSFFFLQYILQLPLNSTYCCMQYAHCWGILLHHQTAP